MTNILTLWRFSLGRHLVHIGLKVMPESHAKRELEGLFLAWGDHVRTVVESRRAASEQGK